MNRWTRADQVPQVKMKVKLKVQVKVKDDLVSKDWPGRHKCKQGFQTCRSKMDTNLLSSSNSINPDMTTVKSLISSLSIVREQKGSKSPGSSLRSIRTTFTIAINALCLQLFSPEQNRNINRTMYNCTHIGQAIMSKNKRIIANLHRLHWRGSTAQ